MLKIWGYGYLATNLSIKVLGNPIIVKHNFNNFHPTYALYTVIEETLRGVQIAQTSL